MDMVSPEMPGNECEPFRDSAVGQDWLDIDANDAGPWLQVQLARVTACRRAVLERAGCLDRPLAQGLEARGKYLRPQLMLGFSMLSPRGDYPGDDVIAAAAAIEALHECSLVHDDIVDRSTMRRGQPSVAAAFDVRTAAHAGAYLAAWAIATLAQSCRRAGLGVDLSALRELAEAEIVETLPPAGTAAVHLLRTRRIVLGKTGVLLHLAIEIGARFGALRGGLTIAPAELRAFSEALSLAYQIRDDILDLENDERLRRPGNNDLRDGKASWPVTLWISSQSDPEAAWRSVREAADDGMLAERLRRDILESDAFATARENVDARLNRARAVLEPMPASLGRRLLLGVLECLRVP
jgi:geranylgeranyl pyrophosphate synthase